ncbi:MAG: phosphoribosylanthranilate isomerase [Verrucomicrobia bacterium]|nr:phosphoribosylanthranilate isomerase [Deltaproteobacteria bacterium]
MVKVKICGITNLEDALTAVNAGADALGFVFYSASPRYVSPEQAAEIIRRLPPFVQTVGLFVDEHPATVNATADQCGLDLVQLHGEETPEYCASIRRRVLKAFRVRDKSTLDSLLQYHVAGYLLDAWSPVAHGGTGQIFNWEIAAEAVQRGHRIVLAGGLTPENIAESIRQVRPHGVDVSSGVESAPGRKDPFKIRLLIERTKQTS